MGWPRVVDLIDTQVRVFEQVRSLVVNLERILVGEEIEIQQPARHASGCMTDGCKSTPIVSQPPVPLACH
jgi:hypothetical protein